MLRGIHAGRSKCTCRRSRADTFCLGKVCLRHCAGKVGDLLAEAGGTLAAVNEDERRRLARRLRKAKCAAPLNLLPLLTLLLAAAARLRRISPGGRMLRTGLTRTGQKRTGSAPPIAAT